MWNNKENIVKYNGRCHNRAKQKYCYYWRAKTSNINKSTLGYFCSLFDQDKNGYSSLKACNKKYGLTFDGRVDGTASGF